MLFRSRENAALTHYCNLLVGCSSGITWLSTSTAAKVLPMIQLLDSNAYFLNAPSRDFLRYGIGDGRIIELFNNNHNQLLDCIKTTLAVGFEEAKMKFNQPLPLQFRTTRKIVYNLICYLQIGSIVNHAKIQKSVFGFKAVFWKEFMLGLLLSPLTLIQNKIRKAGRNKNL